eukprot:scaffold32118_cov77-Cyclotella_meneghiniana.AAC.3
MRFTPAIQLTIDLILWQKRYYDSHRAHTVSSHFPLQVSSFCGEGVSQVREAGRELPTFHIQCIASSSRLKPWGVVYLAVLLRVIILESGKGMRSMSALTQ